MIEKLKNSLFEPKHASALGLFRILFGSLMLIEMLSYLSKDVPGKMFGATKIFFPYNFSAFLPDFSADVILAIIYLNIVACVAIIIGKFYRIALTVFLIGLSLIFFSDKSLYNNHIYLFVLLSFILLFVKGDKWGTLKHKFKSATIPNWNYLILKLQIVIVYFFGGVSKLTEQWLNGSVARATFENNTVEFLNRLATNEAAINFIVYGGLFYDLLIGFLLLFKKTRLIVIPVILFFNITNAIMFDDIGIFPYFMIASLLLFYKADLPQKLYDKFIQKHKNKKVKIANYTDNNKKLIPYFFGAYLLIQTLLPLRHFLSEGDPDWNYKGHYFSWRMKVQTRDLQTMKFSAISKANQQQFEVKMQEHINFTQYKLLGFDPEASIRYANYLKKYYQKKQRKQVGVYGLIKIELNGSGEFFDMINPQYDLTDASKNNMEQWLMPKPN